MPDPPGTQWLKTARRQPPMYVVGKPPGLKTPGNLDLYARPTVRNPDGSISTVYSMSISTDNGAYLLPRVIGDRVVSEPEALAHWKQTGENLGLFDTEDNANLYAKALHEQQDEFYGSQNSQTPR